VRDLPLEDSVCGVKLDVCMREKFRAFWASYFVPYGTLELSFDPPLQAQLADRGRVFASGSDFTRGEVVLGSSFFATGNAVWMRSLTWFRNIPIVVKQSG